jgi:3'-phosphoadenosine 5'-phosphosulfate sulfotransferase (PAPS reductase)/FAD synthetase/3'-phosphoadenosine 5'-phosphosulfate sulfotransferase
LLKIIVRSRKDAKAVEAALERFMPGWGIEVVNVGGARGDRLAQAIIDEMEPFSVALLGREDSEVAAAVQAAAPPLSAVIVSRAAKVRNNTVEMIYSDITRARVRIRLATFWDGEAYIFSGGLGGSELEGIPYTPQGDSFFLFGRGARTLSLFMMKNVGTVPLLFKAEKGKHIVFSGDSPVGEFYAEDKGEVPKAVPYREARARKVSLETVVERNSPVMKALEEKSAEVLRRMAPDPDTVIVPWSGGKDSTAALLVAIKAYGRDAVKAVYVDTGIDFLENAEYVEKLASKLGVDLIYKRANVDEGLLIEDMPMPDPDYRWCTGRKLDALREGFREAAKGKTIVVTGDRDGESEKRGKRPVLRYDEKLGYPVVSPLKLWSGSHVQTYILWKGLPLNPLYEAGFYRIGCYICFALRSWEINVMKMAGIFRRILRERPSHKVLIDRFLELKRKGHGGEFGDCICGV